MKHMIKLVVAGAVLVSPLECKSGESSSDQGKPKAAATQNAGDKKTEPPKNDGAKSEASKSDGAKSEASKSDGTKPSTDGAKPEAPKADGAKPAAAKTDGAKPEAGKSDEAKPETAKDGGAKPEAPKADAAKPEAPKAAGGKLSALTVEDVKAVATKNGYKVSTVREIPPQLDIKTTAINLSKTTVVVLSRFPKNSPYIERMSKDDKLQSHAREGDFVLTVRSPAKAKDARQKLLQALKAAAAAK